MKFWELSFTEFLKNKIFEISKKILTCFSESAESPPSRSCESESKVSPDAANMSFAIKKQKESKIFESSKS